MADIPDDSERLRFIRVLLTGLFIIAAIYMAHFARDFLVPVVFALLIAITFRPVISRLSKLGIPPWGAAVFFIGSLILIGFLGLYLLTGPVSTWISEAPAKAQIFAQKLSDLRNALSDLVRLTKRIEEAAASQGQAQEPMVVQQAASPFSYFSFLAPITGYSIGVIASIILSLVISAFLMASGDLFYEKLVRVMPTLSDKKKALRMVYDIEHEISSYLLSVAAINAVLGLAIGTTFLLIGMPAPYLWAVLVFALNFIPYIGAVVGVGLAGFMAVVTFDSLAYALLAPLAYVVWNAIENQFATPLVLGRRLELNSVAILLMLAFWSWLWGLAGTVLAVPLLVALKTCCDHVESLSTLGEFLSARHEEQELSEAEKKIS